MTGKASFLIKQFRCNWLYFLFYFGGAILFLSVIFTCFNYHSEIANLSNIDFISDTAVEIELTQECDLQRIKGSNATIYMQGAKETYDIDVVYGYNTISVPDHLGGVALITVPDSFPIADITPNASYSEFQNKIWIEKQIAETLLCNIDDEIELIGNKTNRYKIAGFYDEAEITGLFTFCPSFMFFTDGQGDFSETKAIFTDLNSLSDFSDSVNESDYVDSDGYISMCKSYKTIKTLFYVLCAVLSFALFVYILTAIVAYMRNHSALFDNLYVLGITRGKIIVLMAILFAIPTLLSSAIALGLGYCFKAIIDAWALNILNITMSGNLYITAFLIGIPILLAVIFLVVAICTPKEIKL